MELVLVSWLHALLLLLLTFAAPLGKSRKIKSLKWNKRRHPLLGRQWEILPATNIHNSIEEMLQPVFPMWSEPKYSSR
jgi:hypothetical protein